MTVRTRFAPSPTGYLHLGGLRTALYTYLFAKKNGGKFILRIEDTDQEREVPGAVELIYKSLREAGLEYDEGPDVGGDYGPYIQTQRRGIYLPYAMQLVESGAAYPCFCTKEELQARRDAATARGEQWKYDKHCLNIPKEEALRRMQSGEPYVIRQNIPLTGTASFDDALYGHVEAPCDTLDDNVLIKADGLPTYNFANVIDDHLMGITHVMRGTEYLSSAPKYNLLYEAFGWQPPVYIHLSPVMKDATRKLSKRYGDPSFEDLLAQGYVRDAIINFIALLGWSPGDEREFFTLDELVQAMRTKRYATARLRRLVLDAALGYTGDLPALPPYLHVLGANETGLAVLRCARQAALLPLSHSLADLAARSAPAARVAAAHAAAEDLTALCLRHPAPMGAAYTAKPVFPTSGAK